MVITAELNEDTIERLNTTVRLLSLLCPTMLAPTETIQISIIVEKEKEVADE